MSVARVWDANGLQPHRIKTFKLSRDKHFVEKLERWFAEITRKRIRRGSFKSVADLIEAIQLYIDHNNTNPKPFVWTKCVDQILEKVARCKDASVTEH
jgi:hypothetical protein